MEQVTVRASTWDEAEKQLKRRYGSTVKVFSRKKIETRSLFGRKRILYEVTGYFPPKDEPVQTEPEHDDTALEQKAEVRRKLTELLEDNEFPSAMQKALLERFDQDSGEDDQHELLLSQSRLLAVITDIMQPLFPEKRARTNASILLGPTGAGKTTTTAKLAAAQREQAAIISIDTYRIGAQAQVEAYGKLMEVPTAVVRGVAEMRYTLEKLKKQQHLIIDTIGRSPEDKEIGQRMEALLEPCRQLRSCLTLLTLPASMKYSDLVRCAKRFASFTPDGLVITKLDESERIGELLAALHEIGLPIFYAADGQQVPGDLHEGSWQFLMKRLHGFDVDLEHLSR
ncbi:MAG: hypothetical protein ACQEQU_04520 [Spirochaetota bacterium]